MWKAADPMWENVENVGAMGKLPEFCPRTHGFSTSHVRTEMPLIPRERPSGSWHSTLPHPLLLPLLFLSERQVIQLARGNSHGLPLSEE